MANPQGLAAQYTNPMATQYMGAAGDATAGAIRGVGFNEVEAARNPYSQALHNRLSEAGQRAYAALQGTEGLRGARSFGDTMTGQRFGQIDRELLSKGSDIDYQTYQDALAQKNIERNRMLAGGGQYGQLAGQAQNITSDATRLGLGGLGTLFEMGERQTAQGLQNAGNQIGAGRYVRNYNQGVANTVAQDMLDEQNWPRLNLANTLGVLGSFQSDTGPSPGAPTSGARWGEGLKIAGDVLNSGGLDDPFDVVPDDGSVGPQLPSYLRF
jgi:hypothetical protein